MQLPSVSRVAHRVLLEFLPFTGVRRAFLDVNAPAGRFTLCFVKPWQEKFFAGLFFQFEMIGLCGEFCRAPDESVQ